MGFVNNGYQGWSRSNRSQQAIDRLEVPENMINRNTVQDAISKAQADYGLTDDQARSLGKIPIYVWKSQPASSWHHTGKYFNKTNHYNLSAMAERFIEKPELVDNAIKTHRENETRRKRQAKDFSLVTYSKDVWKRSGRFSRIDHTERGFAISPKSQNRIYPVAIIQGKALSKDASARHYQKLSNSLRIDEEFSKYGELTSAHSEFRNTKKLLTAKLQALGLKSNQKSLAKRAALAQRRSLER